MKPGTATCALPNLLAGRNSFREDCLCSGRSLDLPAPVHPISKTRAPRLLLSTLSLLLLLPGLAVASRAQSQEQKPPQNQQANSQSSSQTQSTPPNAPPQNQKGSPVKKKRVYTEDDLAGIKGGVSVVGHPNATSSQASLAPQTSEPPAGSGDSEKKDEKYWRDRAAQLHAQMDSLDQQIKDLHTDIQKNGATGFDPQKGLKDNVIYVDDKNARLQQMQKKRADLDRKLDDLQEEGRKAGIPSSWVR